jgi:hypothetical protein
MTQENFNLSAQNAKEEGDSSYRLKTMPEPNCPAHLAKELAVSKSPLPECCPEKVIRTNLQTQPLCGDVSTLFEGQMDFLMPDEDRVLPKEAGIWAGRCPGCGSKPVLYQKNRTFQLFCRSPYLGYPEGKDACTFPKPGPMKDPRKLIRIWNLSLKLSQ